MLSVSDIGGPRMAKLYESKIWLRRQHITNGKSVDEIAAMCGVSHMTIRRKMENFGIRIVK
jgi:transposase